MCKKSLRLEKPYYLKDNIIFCKKYNKYIYYK